jgi:hypothetical protein
MYFFFLWVLYITMQRYTALVPPGSDGTSYRDAMRASLFACDDNPLINAFFSKRNIESLQTQMRIIMKEKYGHVISKQSETELVLIMRGIFALHGNTVSSDINCQVKQLNAEVLGYVIPHIKSNVDHYIGYLRDSTQPYRLLDRPQNTSLKGEQTLQLFSP